MPRFHIGRDGECRVIMRHSEVTETEVSDQDLRALLAEYSTIPAADIQSPHNWNRSAKRSRNTTLLRRARDRMTDEIDNVISRLRNHERSHHHVPLIRQSVK